MPVREEIDTLIQRALGDVFEAHLPALRAEIARRVSEQLEPAAPVSNHVGIPEIASAVQVVQSATTQTDVLVALLNGATKFAARAALFVVRSGNAIGWQARGLDEHVLKALHLSTDQGTIGRVTRDAVTVTATAREFDAGFVAAMGIPGEQECLTVPLVVKDRVAALIYADGGNNGTPMNPAALELLVRSTALWLEVLTTRKASAIATSAASGTAASETMSAAEKVVEAVSPATQPAMPPVSAEAAPSPTAPPAAPPDAKPASVTPAPVAAAEPAPQDQEIHNKARRFAKLLVDEIKLYNQEKVAEGKRNRSLYDALRDDIDKSRATYDKRYSATAAAAGDYFNKELIRSLADNDASFLGSNYPG